MLKPLHALLSTLTLLLPGAAWASTTPQTLPFSQSWTGAGLITVNDNWSGVPGVEGYLGQDITTATGTDPQTLLGVSLVANDLDVIANQSNTTITNGGVAEFDGIANPTVALQGSGTADAPSVRFYLNTTGCTGITVAYNLRDLDGTTDNAVQPVALQFRVGGSGNFTNLPAGFVADATTGPSLATLVTPVAAALPAAANNQAVVQVRVITANAAGNDEWVGVDDISVTGTCSGGPPPPAFIHDVQGSGSATPVPGAIVTVEGVVIGAYQGSTQLQGFFLQEEDADADANPATSEGIFIFCQSCPTAVAEGQRVRVTGTVSEFNNMTEITASTAGSVAVTNAGNNLSQVTPAPIDLPVAGDVNAFYEAREGMRVTFVDTLTVSEYFELFRFGHIELFEGGRPRQFTEISTPSVAGYAAHLAALDRRRVIVDDTDDIPNGPLTLAEGSQLIYHPRANGGFSVGTQGTDFFRGGDVVNNLTGVLHWSFAGTGSVNTWRLRPTAATPVTFTVANPRQAVPPVVPGAIRAAGMNLLNYFTTIDTTASSSAGPCGPSGTLDCRGADSVAELARQRERTSIVVCGLNADVVGFVEVENTATATINDLLGAVNARCGGAHPYAFVSTGGTLGADAIRVALIYRTGVLSPVGPPAVDLDSIHSRPPTAQTFDVVDTANPAFGERFTVIANHFKSKGSSAGLPGDTDIGDGAGASNATRTAQANRLISWVNGTVVPAAGDPDVLLLGDFNAYAQEDPVTAITGGGYTDLGPAILGSAAYSYLFDGQLGHLDYAFASASLTPQVTGAGIWHINSDEVPILDYSDEIRDVGEAAFEEKPDGSALAPPRSVFQPASPYRASDHDPVLVGLFETALDFYTVPTCRLVDTRPSTPLQSGVPRTFALHGLCGIPATARTVVLNITVFTPTASGELSVQADGTTPSFSTMSFSAGVVRALLAFVSLDAAGEVEARATVAGNGSVHLLLDVTGYFE